MSTSLQGKGSCLCGAVKVEALSMNPNVGACHCNMCRKWTGGPLLAVDCNQQVTIFGEEHVSIYSSSAWAQRGFCSQCGTHLFYKLLQNGQYIMPAGLFDLEESLTLEHQIFIDEKPDYYCFENDTKKMTGAEVFAAYSSE